MRFNPFRRGGGPRLNNRMGQMAAPFQLPPQGQLDIPLEELLGGLSEDAGPPPELDADQNRQLVELLQAVSPSSVRDAVLTTPAQAKARPAPSPALDMTPEELAMVLAQQQRLSAGPEAIRPRIERAFPRRMGQEDVPVFAKAPRLQAQGRARTGPSLGTARTPAEARLAQLQNAGQITGLQSLLTRASGRVAPASIGQLQNAGQVTGMQALLMRMFPNLR